jgi:small subunit ribosomal protein S20
VPHSLSAKKRDRQSKVRLARNKARKSAVKTQIRKFEDALKEEDLAAAETEYRKTAKALDQTASTSAMHKNAASRKKSRLAKRLNAAKTKA